MESRRWIARLLAVCMLAPMLPVSALAETLTSESEEILSSETPEQHQEIPSSSDAAADKEAQTPQDVVVAMANQLLSEESTKEDKPAEQEAAPAEETPDEETPDEEIPDEEIPDEETPDEETPDEETPDEETPDEEIPDEETPDEEIPDEETPDITPDEVRDSIDQAQNSETDAAKDAITSGQIVIAGDEASAIIDQIKAEEKLDAAEEIIDKADEANGELADTAEEAADAALDAETEADNQNDAAQDAADEAEDALEDALNAGTKQEAEQAADSAEEKSEAADLAAAEAHKQAQIAEQKAKDAEAAYQAASEAALKADEEARALLEQGLISAEEAKEKTEAAAKLAEERYNEMLQAQQEAEAATAAAKAEADAAKEELKAAADELEKIAAENAQNIAEKTETVLVVGGALVATQVAVEVAEKVVAYYEGEIADLQAQVDELDAVIAEAQKAIDEAQAQLDALDEEDAEYPTAKRALEAAQAAKDSAQAIKDNAQAILDAKAEAESNNTAQQMKDLQDKVNAGEATDAEKQALTNLVLGSIGNYNQDVSFDNIQWVEDETGLFFYVEDAEGNKSYYEVKEETREDGTKYLQYYKSELKTETEVNSIPSAKDAYDSTTASGGVSPTAFKVYDENGNAYNVVVRRTKVFGKETFTYIVDMGQAVNPMLSEKNGSFYMVSGFSQIPLTVVDTTLSHFETEDSAIGTNSDTISDMWATAENAQEELKKAEEKLDEAQKNFDEAEKVYNEVKAELNEIIRTNTAVVTENKAKRDNLTTKIVELDKKLNGGTADKLLRALLEGNTEEGAEVARRIGELTLKAMFGTLTEEEAAELEELKSSLADSTESGKKILNIITGLADGDLSLEDAQNVIELLADTSLSAKTRLAIAEKIESVLEEAYNDATRKLQEAINQAKEELTAQQEVVADAARNAAEKELTLAGAMLKEAVAKKATAEAEQLKDLANKANDDARKAYEDYLKLANSHGTDFNLVEKAREAYELARASAIQAQALASEASLAAERAKAAAEEARRIADAFPVPESTSSNRNEQGTMSIAAYANSFVGLLGEDFAKNLSNSYFVEIVFARYGYIIDLSSNKLADVLKNGVRIDKAQVQENDIVCFLSADGTTVQRFGIYYYNDIYIFFNESSRQIESARCAQAGLDWCALRIAQ